MAFSLPLVRTLFGILLGSFVCAAAGAQSVLVVDAANGPGADHSDLRAAIEAAGDGDVLLIRSGVYRPATGISVFQKGLVLQAEVGADVAVDVSFAVTGLGSGQFFAARGVDFQAGIQLSDCSGVVWLEDGRVDPDPFLGPGASISNCFAVVLRSCSLESGYSFASAVTAGLTAVDSNVYAFECAFEGVAGSDGVDFGGTLFPPDPGGSGVLAWGASQVWLYASTIHAGDSGNWTGFVDPPQPGVDGAAGVQALAGATVNVLGSSVQGASGGTGGGGGSPGAAGSAFDIEPPARLVTWPEAPRSKSVPSPLRENETFTITHQGLAGDSVWALLSSRPAALVVPRRRLGRPGATVLRRAWTGPVVTGFPLYAALFQGRLPGSGQRDLSLDAPSLLPGRSALVLFDQSMFLGARSFVAGAPTLVVVLDDTLVP